MYELNSTFDSAVLGWGDVVVGLVFVVKPLMLGFSAWLTSELSIWTTPSASSAGLLMVLAYHCTTLVTARSWSQMCLLVK